MMDDVLTELRLAGDSLDRMGSAQRNFMNAVRADSEALWRDIAELRDELCAVANRVENLTRALTTEPAEVAERMLRDADA